MKLYIITFIPCDTQFLVNQKTKENALKSAISANKLVGDVEGEKMDDEKLYLHFFLIGNIGDKQMIPLFLIK